MLLYNAFYLKAMWYNAINRSISIPEHCCKLFFGVAFMAEHELLTLEEVADYLRVSERTVYDWANKGEIPCGKLGTAWRFKRSDVEKWVDSKLSRPNKAVRMDAVTLRDVLAPDRTLLLDCRAKDEAATPEKVRAATAVNIPPFAAGPQNQ